MANITGGSVTFGRTVQPAQYESKKAEVTITFAIPEDDSPDKYQFILDGAASMAQSKALELLGLKQIDARVAAADATAPRKDATMASLPEKLDERPGSKRGPKSKAEKEVAAAAEAVKAAAVPAGDDLLGDVQRDKAAETANEGKEAAAAAQADKDDDLLGASAPQPITDKDLMDAVTKKMTETNNPKGIKDVRALFVQSPLGIKDIPQDKRAAFLEKLKDVKKA